MQYRPFHQANLLLCSLAFFFFFFFKQTEWVLGCSSIEAPPPTPKDPSCPNFSRTVTQALPNWPPAGCCFTVKSFCKEISHRSPRCPQEGEAAYTVEGAQPQKSERPEPVGPQTSSQPPALYLENGILILAHWVAVRIQCNLCFCFCFLFFCFQCNLSVSTAYAGVQNMLAISKPSFSTKKYSGVALWTFPNPLQ